MLLLYEKYQVPCVIFKPLNVMRKLSLSPINYIRVSYVWKLGMLSFFPHTFSG